MANSYFVHRFDRSKGDALMLVAALIWGLAFYFQKTAMSHIGPLLFLGLRSAVAVLALVPFALAEQKHRQAGGGSVTRFGLLGGLVFFLAGSLQQFGIVTATVTNTGFLTALYVVATPFVYWLFKRESPPRIIWVAAALSFIGTWSLGGGSIARLTEGDWLVAASATVWAVHIVITGESGKLAQPLTYTCIQFAVVAILGLSLAVVYEPIVWGAIIEAADSILYVGLLSSAFTFGIMAIALRRIAAPRASVMLSLETVFAAAAGYALLGERLTVLGWCGATLILSAVLVLRLQSVTRENP